MFGVESFYYVVAFDFDIDEVAELSFERVKDFVEGTEFGGVAGLESDFLSGLGVYPVVECDFEYFG